MPIKEFVVKLTEF